MFHSKHAIWRVLLVLLHLRSLLAESFSRNLVEKEDSISETFTSFSFTATNRTKSSRSSKSSNLNLFNIISSSSVPLFERIENSQSSEEELDNSLLSESLRPKILIKRDNLTNDEYHRSNNNSRIYQQHSNDMHNQLVYNRTLYQKCLNDAFGRPKNKSTVYKQYLNDSYVILNNDTIYEKCLNYTYEIENRTDHATTSDDHIPPMHRGIYFKYVTFLTCLLYASICMIGLCGNSLVIYVVLRFSKMQTVTNMYILNLALADEMFLFGLPFLITTITYNQWAFGKIMCKIYMIMTSINQFTSSLLLTVMSADRYIAVCHPISSPRYRTPCIAKVICLSVWTLSAYLMAPIAFFSDVQDTGTKLSCNIFWPEMESFSGQKAFTIYSFTLGFFVPLILILLFYFMVICKLRTISTKHKSKEKKKTQKKVTYMVLVVISCYICCWLPYWITQVYITFQTPRATHNEFMFIFMLLAGCLSYANSALNPILYAFLSENFKKSFAKAFTCTSNVEMNSHLHNENSVFPQQHNLSKGKQSSSSRVETASTYLDSNSKKKKGKKFEPHSSKSNLKDTKKQNHITASTLEMNLRKDKRLSLDLNVLRTKNHLGANDEFIEKNNNSYHIDNNQVVKLADLLKPNILSKDELPSSCRQRVNEPDQIDKGSNQDLLMSNAQSKRRRRSEPKLLMSNMISIDETGQSATRRRRSTLASQDDVESGRKNEEFSSDVDEDDLDYQSDEENDYEGDSSLESSQADQRNCAAVPARLKAKFLSNTSGSKFRSLSRKPTPLKRTHSSNELEEVVSQHGSTRSMRKQSFVSSESSQTKKCSKNKLLNLMNKLTSKQMDKSEKQHNQTTTEVEHITGKRPETRVSRKRISRAEAEFHRFGNLRRIQINKNIAQFNISQTVATVEVICKCESKRVEEDKQCEACSNKSDERTIVQLDGLEEKRSSKSACKSLNDNNNNYETIDNDQLMIGDTNCKNSESCVSKEGCAQCSQCLEKRGVIQTDL